MAQTNNADYISSLMKRYEEGDVFAMAQIGDFYYEDNPHLFKEDKIDLVIDCYTKAAAAGHSKSALNLGVIYFEKAHAPEEFEKAIELFKSAISGESARIAALASSWIGECYLYGLGVKRDLSLAFDYFLDGVLLSSHPVSLYKLGDMYRFGLFVRKDIERAYSIYEKAKRSSQQFGDYAYPDILIRMADLNLEDGGLGDINAAIKFLTLAKRAPERLAHEKGTCEKIDSLLGLARNLKK